MKPIVRFFNRIIIYSVIAYGIVFCFRQPISAQAPGGRPLKYYGVDQGNPVTDANYTTLSQHSVNTVIFYTELNGSASYWQNIVSMAKKYNFKLVILPADRDDPVSNCGWANPFHKNASGDFIWEVKPLLDAIGGDPTLVGIITAHEPMWTCITSINDMATIRTQLKDYVRNKFGRDIQDWVYVDNVTDLTNISDYKSGADIGRIMDVALTWQHCFGTKEGSCSGARTKIINDRNAINSAGLDGKVDLVFLFQTFSYGSGYRIPSLSEMQQWDCNFLSTGALDGFMYYTWGTSRNSPSGWYDSDLTDHQELWPEMNRVYNECANKSSPTPTPLSGGKLGDANGDNRVDGLDYIIWLNHFNQTTTAGPSAGDFNRSGKVDGLDYVVWLNNFGK